jgi:hypothetical protein
MEEKELLAILFGRLEISTEEQLETILQTMNTEVATVFLIHATKYAYERGIYNIGETEVISKCIRILSK